MKDCRKPAKIRGLCKADYNVAYRLVATGLTQWSLLEQMGKAKPPGPRGPKSQAARFLNGKAKR